MSPSFPVYMRTTISVRVQLRNWITSFKRTIPDLFYADKSCVHTRIVFEKTIINCTRAWFIHPYKTLRSILSVYIIQVYGLFCANFISILCIRLHSRADDTRLRTSGGQTSLRKVNYFSNVNTLNIFRFKCIVRFLRTWFSPQTTCTSKYSSHTPEHYNLWPLFFFFVAIFKLQLSRACILRNRVLFCYYNGTFYDYIF